MCEGVCAYVCVRGLSLYVCVVCVYVSVCTLCVYCVFIVYALPIFVCM